MVRPMTIHGVETFSSPIPLAIGLFVSASLLVALCAKHARQNTQKSSSQTNEPNTPKPPLPSPAKKLIATISQKAMVQIKKTRRREYSGGREGERGLWQKAILMGEKCQPPEFSGVIYYDCSGNRIPEMPKSPRAAAAATPLRSSFNFPTPEKIDKAVYS